MSQAYHRLPPKKKEAAPLPPLKPEDYRHIAAWGKMMGSFHSYVVEQQEEAAYDRAPADAIYKCDGVWQCYHQVTLSSTRNMIDSFMSHKRRQPKRSK